MKKKNFYWLAVEKETLFKTPISKLFSGTYSTRFGSKEVIPPPPPLRTKTIVLKSVGHKA